METTEIVAFVRTVPIFYTLSSDQLQLLAEQVMPQIADLWSEWENHWWPKPMPMADIAMPDPIAVAQAAAAGARRCSCICRPGSKDLIL